MSKTETKTNRSQPGAVGNDMAAALKGERPGCVPKNYLGRPANAKPLVLQPGQAVPDGFQSTQDYTQENMQERRKYNQGKESKWGLKWDQQGNHTNAPYWNGNSN